MRAMKNSGIAWIKEIPSNWKVMPNKHLMNKIKTIRDKYLGEDVLSLTMRGVLVRDLDNPMGKMPATFDGYQYVEAGNLLMCLFDIDVTPRCIGLISNNGVCSPAYSQFKLKSIADAEYYYYYYLNLDYTKELLHLAKNLRYSLTEEQFGLIPTVVPPLEAQKKISTFLKAKTSQVDSLISNVQSQIEKLKAYKQSLITEVVTKGLDPNVEMKGSGVEWIGDLPKHYKYIKSFYVCEKIGDIDHYMPQSVAEGYPYVMTGDLKSLVSNIDFKLCKKISLNDFSKLSKKIIPEKGDVIFARYATIGNVCYVDVNIEFLVSYSCVTIKPKKNIIVGKYLWYYYQSNTFMEEVKFFINANTQGNVGVDALNKTKLIVPPLNEQIKNIQFLDIKCSQIEQLISIKQLKIAKLEQYKRSIIYEYVTGKKEVS